MRMNFTYAEIKEAQDFLVKYWGEAGERVIAAIFNMNDDELLWRGTPSRNFYRNAPLAVVIGAECSYQG